MSPLGDPRGALSGLTRLEGWVLGVSAAFLLFLLVAMLTGFVILGTTITAWRSGADRRIR